jgi:hypothetical protein
MPTSNRSCTPRENNSRRIKEAGCQRIRPAARVFIGAFEVEGIVVSRAEHCSWSSLLSKHASES